jgi:Flp pilus assembly protein CpaB
VRLLPHPTTRAASSGVRREPRIPGRAPAWQRRWRRHRRALAALLAAVVVWSVTTAVHPPSPATRLVVTAGRDLAPGSTLSPSDLVLLARPQESLARDAASDLTALDGRVVAVPVLAGEVLRGRDVVGRSLLASLGSGVVATTVRLSDEAGLASVRPGDLVDVVAARGGESTEAAAASIVASRVRVLTVASSSAGGGGLLGGSTSSGSPVLLVATSAQQALDIAAAAVGSRLSVTLRSG